MTLSQNGLNFIKQFEGCELSAYLDIAGVPTIGWGTIIYKDGTHVKLGDTISQGYADILLQWQISLKITGLAPLITATLNQNQIDSLISFSYNEGIGAFQTSTLRRLINANPNDPAITPAFLMWTKVRIDGKFVSSNGLKSRRIKEAALYFTT